MNNMELFFPGLFEKRAEGEWFDLDVSKYIEPAFKKALPGLMKNFPAELEKIAPQIFDKLKPHFKTYLQESAPELLKGLQPHFQKFVGNTAKQYAPYLAAGVGIPTLATLITSGQQSSRMSETNQYLRELHKQYQTLSQNQQQIQKHLQIPRSPGVPKAPGAPGFSMPNAYRGAYGNKAKPTAFISESVRDGVQQQSPFLSKLLTG